LEYSQLPVNARAHFNSAIDWSLSTIKFAGQKAYPIPF
jgi:hypothetical protein